MGEGSRILLSRYRLSRGLYKEERLGRQLDSKSLVMMCEESPKESFEILFPRYHITCHRGVSLWGFYGNLSFFSRHPRSGLLIESYNNSSGEIKNMNKGRVSRALRKPFRREEEYLKREAAVILRDVLSVAKIYNNYEIVVEELKEAFSNLGLS